MAEVKNEKLTMKRFLWSLLLIAQIIFLFSPSKEILHADSKGPGWIYAIVIFITLPFAAGKLFDTFAIDQKYKDLKIIVFLFPFIFGISFGIYHGGKEVAELKKKGKWTTGVVVETKTGKHGYEWMIKVSYVIENKTFETKYEEDRNDSLEVGDSVRLIYSSDFPKIYLLEDDWKAATD